MEYENSLFSILKFKDNKKLFLGIISIKIINFFCFLLLGGKNNDIECKIIFFYG